MSRTKIDFGIDLGTTNSAIALMENGEIQVIKSDKWQKDTMPSCVQFTRKKQVKVGDDALAGYLQEAAGVSSGPPNAFIEFKRTMGTDKTYHSTHMDESYSSEDLSSEVLKKLRSYVKGEDIQAAVVTVPNQFKQNQIDATQRATTLAGLKHCELLQEPIAASLAFGIESKLMQGFWVVFDFGGGTFDVALMRVDEGIMKVIDTGGDNHLGGKDIDTAVVDKLLLPQLQREYTLDNLLADESAAGALLTSLKRAAEEIKIALSKAEEAEWMPDEPIGKDDVGLDIDPEIKISLTQFEDVVRPIFQKAVNITKQLLERNKIETTDVDSILLVGGPTLSQTLRRLLKDEFGDRVDTSVDPMTSVARGAALFASTKSVPDELQQRDRKKVQLTLKYPETTVETEESLGVRIEKDRSDADVPGILWIELSRSDGLWSSGKVKIEDVEIVDFVLEPGKTNAFSVRVTDESGDQIASEPAQFSVIQGLTAAKATIPHSICVESLITGEGRSRLVLLEGLAKNTSLPAKGRGTFKTQKDIRPGDAGDVIRIPLIEGNPGERASYNPVAAIVECTGEDLSEFLPEGSEVELTVEMDGSRRITLTAYFPYIDDTWEIAAEAVHDTQQTEHDSNELHQEIRKAQETLNLIEGPDSDRLAPELEALDERLTLAGNDYAAKDSVFEHLQGVLKEIDLQESRAEWPEAKVRLIEAVASLKNINEQYGDDNSSKVVAEIEASADIVIGEENVGLANGLIEQVSAAQFALVRNQTGLWISYVKGFDDDFGSQEWSDRAAARALIDEAKRVIATAPSREKLEAIVFQLFDLLPDKDTPIVSDSDRELLRQ
jgi:molecular chaperone DnaK